MKEFSKPADSKTNMVHNVYSLCFLLETCLYTHKATYKDVQCVMTPERQFCQVRNGMDTCLYGSPRAFIHILKVEEK